MTTVAPLGGNPTQPVGIVPLISDMGGPGAPAGGKQLSGVKKHLSLIQDSFGGHQMTNTHTQRLKRRHYAAPTFYLKRFSDNRS